MQDPWPVIMHRTGSSQKLLLAATAVLACTVILTQALWIGAVLDVDDRAALTQRDWIAFYRTGHRLVSGDLDSIYTFRADGTTGQDLESGFFFLYPPFVAWVTFPLGFLGIVAGYTACVASVLLLVSSGFAGLLVLLRTTAVQRLLATLALVGSMPWWGVTYLGHLGGGLLLAPVSSLWARARNRPVLAGACLGALLAKPNLGLPMVALLVVGRCWRMVGGALLTGAGLVLVSLPLGVGMWADWWQSIAADASVVSDTMPTFKQHTLLAVLRSVTGLPASHPLVLGLWVPAAGFIMLWVASLWSRIGRHAEAFPRLLGISLLAIVVANPRAYFYDLLLLAPAALLLWTRPEAWQRATTRRWAMGMGVVSYYLLYVQFLGVLPQTLSLVGLPLAIWLVLELRDMEPDGGSSSVPSGWNQAAEAPL